MQKEIGELASHFLLDWPKRQSRKQEKATDCLYPCLLCLLHFFPLWGDIPRVAPLFFYADLSSDSPSSYNLSKLDLGDECPSNWNPATLLPRILKGCWSFRKPTYSIPPDAPRQLKWAELQHADCWDDLAEAHARAMLAGVSGSHCGAGRSHGSPPTKCPGVVITNVEIVEEVIVAGTPSGDPPTARVELRIHFQYCGSRGDGPDTGFARGKYCGGL